MSSYQIEYRTFGQETWLPIHQWVGRPVDEAGEKVIVDKVPSELPGCGSEVTTTICGLTLKEVAEIRISANGGHWIGIFELEVFGQR